MFGGSSFTKFLGVIGFLICAFETSSNPFIAILSTVGSIFFWLSLDD